MSEKKPNGLSLIANNSGHIAFNADVSFSIEEKEEIPSVHIADAVYTVVLDALKKQVGGAQLFPGNYRMVLTSCVSHMQEVETGEADNVDPNTATDSQEQGSSETVSEEVVEEAEAPAA